MKSNIILSHDLQQDIALALSECRHDRIFLLVDEVTGQVCMPVISHFLCLKNAGVITIKATDKHKTLDSTVHVWQSLGKGGATRHSCLINLGGGMVTDLGGFAASTFKRGIDFINIPTTLLSMVDASVGGKTGINFEGLKNEIGVFNDARRVIINTLFLQTLDEVNLRSGYAEMLKHGLISDNRHWATLLKYDLQHADLHVLQDMISQSIEIKQRIVAADPHEKGIRKALNLGHTIGHALESLALQKGKDMPHGYAVAFGLICELYLSTVKNGFPTDKLRQTAAFINTFYGKPDITCNDYNTLIELMQHDKKNRDKTINFTLLGDIGDIRINRTASEEDIKNALDFLREGE